MSEIPADILQKAITAYETVCEDPGMDGAVHAIAAALLAERERCAKIADSECHKIGGIPVGDWSEAADQIATAIREQ